MLLLLVLGPISVFAAPGAMKADPAVGGGVLPDGICYFLVQNQAPRGVAEVALLQRACQSVQELPEGMLLRKGILPGEEGYVTCFDGNVLYRFRDVPVAAGETVLDSLLMTVFALADAASRAGEPAYGTTNQTVIISGDIDKGTVLTKMKMFALTIPKVQSAAISDDYLWVPKEGPECRMEPIPGSKDMRLHMSWSAPALPRDVRNSNIGLVAHRMDDILDRLVEETLPSVFLREGLVCSDLSFDVVKADAAAGDASYTLSLSCGPDQAPAAIAVVGGFFGGLGRGGVTTAQYVWASQAAYWKRYAEALRAETNSGYVDRILRSVLYNATLATRLEQVSFFSGKEMSDSLGASLFNRFVSIFDEEALGEIPAVAPVDVNYLDTLSFPDPIKKKMKLKKTVKDPITGANILQFGNGISILYKPMKTSGLLHFRWILRGGLEEVPDLYDGSFGPLKGENFRRLLSACGISLELISDGGCLALDGVAPAAQLQLLTRALALVFSSRPWLGNPRDGLWMIVGDRTEYQIQKGVQNILGCFNTSAASRPVRNYSVKPVIGEDPSVVYELLLSTDYILSSDHFAVLDVAEKVIRHSIGEALEGTGLYAEVVPCFLSRPRDIVCLSVRIRRIASAESTLADYQVPAVVRGAVAALASKPYDASWVGAYKSLATGELLLASTTPKYWLDIIQTRISLGKDLSKASGSIAAVTPEKVRALVYALWESPRMEKKK